MKCFQNCEEIFYNVYSNFQFVHLSNLSGLNLQGSDNLIGFLQRDILFAISSLPILDQDTRISLPVLISIQPMILLSTISYFFVWGTIGLFYICLFSASQNSKTLLLLIVSWTFLIGWLILECNKKSWYFKRIVKNISKMIAKFAMDVQICLYKITTGFDPFSFA